MKKYIFLLRLALILSGCTTLDWNRAWGTAYPAVCPICKSNIGVYDTTSNYQCSHCKNTISAAGAIALYNQYKNIPPDYVTCPYCNTTYDLRLYSLDIQTLQCSYCKRNFERAEGKRLYVQMETQRQNALAPALINSQTQQAIAEEQANRAFADRMQNIYKESAERQQENMRTFQQNTQSIFNNWRKSPDGSRFDPIHIKVDGN